MRTVIHAAFLGVLGFCAEREMTGAAPYFPAVAWTELFASFLIAWFVVSTFMHRRQLAATWRGRVLPVFCKRARFRNLAPQMHTVLDSLLADNREPKSVADLRMSPATTAKVKMLLYRFEQLGISSPSGREIVEWIDWLPYMVSLAEDEDLKTARTTNPRDRTIQRFRHHNRTGTKDSEKGE